tara:strand:+ start:3498 stop:3971 length:474 start_codon:yes stop_codon:yes gene_type:complete
MNYLDKLYEARSAQANDDLKDSFETAHIGRVVEVYYNTHRGRLSVRDAKTKKVFAHTHVVYLEDVSFTVQPAGRDKVRKTNRKNVHAWVRGTVVEMWRGMGYASYRDWLYSTETAPSVGTTVTYNPYKYDSFVTKEEIKVSKAHCAMVYGSGHIEIR